jgi:hypothetical protein
METPRPEPRGKFFLTVGETRGLRRSATLGGEIEFTPAVAGRLLVGRLGGGTRDASHYAFTWRRSVQRGKHIWRKQNSNDFYQEAQYKWRITNGTQRTHDLWDVQSQILERKILQVLVSRPFQFHHDWKFVPRKTQTFDSTYRQSSAASRCKSSGFRVSAKICG